MSPGESTVAKMRSERGRDVVGRPVDELVGNNHLFILNKEALEDHVPIEVVHCVVCKHGDAILF